MKIYSKNLFTKKGLFLQRKKWFYENKYVYLQ